MVERWIGRNFLKRRLNHDALVARWDLITYSWKVILLFIVLVKARLMDAFLMCEFGNSTDSRHYVLSSLCTLCLFETVEKLVISCLFDMIEKSRFYYLCYYYMKSYLLFVCNVVLFLLKNLLVIVKTWDDNVDSKILSLITLYW